MNDPKFRYQVQVEEYAGFETVLDTDDLNLACTVYERTLKDIRYEGLPNEVRLYDSIDEEVFRSDVQTLSKYGEMMLDESI